MKEKSIKENFILYLIKSLSSLLFPIITFAYVSRVISVEGVGKVDFSRSIVSYFTLFSTLGITAYGTREGAKVRDDKEQLSALIKELFSINVITTIITYIAFIIIVTWVPSLQAYKLLLWISGLNIGFSALGMEWFYTATENYRYITARTIVFQIISVAFLLIFVRDKGDYYQYCAILLFSAVGSNTLNFIQICKYADFAKKQALHIVRHIKPIMVFFSNTLAGNVYLTLDTSMVGLLSGDYAVGLYSASNKMNRICLSIVSALSIVLLPRLSYYISKGDEKRYRELLKKCVECVFMLALPITCGMAILSKDIILIFSGADFVEATLCARVMSVIILFISISAVLSNQILIPFGKEKFQLISTIVGAIGNVIVNFALIPKYNELGAGIGTVVSEFLVCFVLCVCAFRVYDLRFALINIWHYLLATFIMGIILLLLPSFAGILTHAIVSVIVGVGCYFSILLLVRDEFLIGVFGNVKDRILQKYFR